nr:unnamed protein product [Callosobruchus chinensis]
MSTEENQVPECQESNSEHRQGSHRSSGVVCEILTRMRMSYETDSIQLPNYNSANSRHRQRDHKEGRPRTTSYGSQKDTISSEGSWSLTTRQQMSFSVSAETSISYVESITGSFVQDLLHDEDNEGSCEEFAPDAAGLLEHESTYHKITASEEQMMMQDDTRGTNTIAFFADLVKTERKSMANALLLSADTQKGTKIAPRKAQVSLPKTTQLPKRSKCCRVIQSCFRRMSRKLSKRKRKKKGKRSLYEDGVTPSDTDEDIENIRYKEHPMNTTAKLSLKKPAMPRSHLMQILRSETGLESQKEFP